MKTGILKGLGYFTRGLHVYKYKWGFPKTRATSLGVPIIRIIVFGGLYWGPPILGKIPSSTYIGLLGAVGKDKEGMRTSKTRLLIVQDSYPLFAGPGRTLLWRIQRIANPGRPLRKNLYC